MNIMNRFKTKKPLVYMMMSGGVDSSVAALELVEQGFDVVGVFMRCWSIDSLEQIGASKDLYGCFWEEDSTDARLVADTLQIPFYVWDFEDEYKKGVVDYMLEEYRNGRTPNPDVMCNSVIKFGIFYEKAMRLGADFVATGHYARVSNTQKNYSLLRGKDSNKDQSYFVWRIKKSQLPHILMPIGEFATKADVRKKAEKYGLLTAQKPDSQGLCFIGETPVRSLLLQTIGQKPGNIIDSQTQKILGQHLGAFQYTIGQRHQLGLGGGPWFVSRIDVDLNTVEVTHADNQQPLLSSGLVAKNLNYFIDLEEGTSYSFSAQIRYRQKPEICHIIKEKNQLLVTFEHPIRAISKGQSIVIYENDTMVCGGIIDA
jgi:tRNA-uridine 2-sulfurtransferase